MIRQEEMVTIGKILKVRGAKGDFTVFPLTDDIARFSLLKEVYIEKADGTIVKKNIKNVMSYKGKVVIKFDGVESGKEAEELLKGLILIPKSERIKLPEDHYFISDLIGADVITLTGENIGKLENMFSTGSNDVFVIRSKEGEKLIPAIKNVIKKVDIEGKKIIINLLEGL